MIKIITIHDIDGIKMIAVDNEVFDWGVDENDFKSAKLTIKDDPMMKEVFLGDIQKHFVNCFSEFIGKKVTLNEINQALINGKIEV